MNKMIFDVEVLFRVQSILLWEIFQKKKREFNIQYSRRQILTDMHCNFIIATILKVYNRI